MFSCNVSDPSPNIGSLKYFNHHPFLTNAILVCEVGVVVVSIFLPDIQIFKYFSRQTRIFLILLVNLDSHKILGVDVLALIHYTEGACRNSLPCDIRAIDEFFCIHLMK